MPKTPDYFHGKTVVITGAASGIGRAAALIFAREGANVVCADINETGVKETSEQVNAIGSQALALDVDVTKRGAVNDMIQLAIDGFGRVDFLFNSAGAAIRRSKFLDIDDDLLERTFDLNFKGTFYAMQAVLPHMLQNKKGVIVNVASMAVKRGGPNSSIHYAAQGGGEFFMWRGAARGSQGRNALPGFLSRGGPPRHSWAPPPPRPNWSSASSTTSRWGASASRRKSASWCCSCARMPASS